MKNYVVPESKIDLHEYMTNQKDNYDQAISDQLYQNAKHSLNRTKILLMNSQQEFEFANNNLYCDENEEIQLSNLSSKRVKKILRNKEKRKLEKVKEESKSKDNRYFREERTNESDSCKMHISSDNEHEGQARDSSQRSNVNISRNYVDNEILSQNKTVSEHNRFIHQTTSSGNMVLYDSAMRASTLSPPEMMIDPGLYEQFNSHHMKVYDTKDEHNLDSDSDEGEEELDILQNHRIAGKYLYAESG